MLNIAQIGLISGFASRLHPRLEAWLARGAALGYTLPSAAQQQKLNTFFYALEAAGIITGVASSLLDVLYLFAIDGNSDMATLNVITPTSFQCSKVNSPAFTSNQGFTGNGTTSFLNTNWNASTSGVNYTTNAASHGGYINSNVDLAQIDWGSSNGTSFLQISSRNVTSSGNGSMTINDNAGLVASNTSTIGFYHCQRTASNARRFFKNGVSVNDDTKASNGIPSLSVFICGRNSNGGISNASTKQIGMFFAGASLDGLESAFYNAWNTYFTSL